MPAFSLVIIIIAVVIRRGYYHSEQRTKVSGKQRKICRRINYIRFEARARRIAPTFVNRAELKRHTCTPSCVNASAARGNSLSLFFSSHAPRPPCQCVDALNWLVILIEFHYSSAWQWTARRSTSENKPRGRGKEGVARGGGIGRAAAFSALDYRKTLHMRVWQRAGNSKKKKKTQTIRAVQIAQALSSVTKIFPGVCKRVKYPAYTAD